MPNRDCEAMPISSLGCQLYNFLLVRITSKEQISYLDQKALASKVKLRIGVCAGSILSGGGSSPAVNATVFQWDNMTNYFQEAAISTRLGIPLIYGIDAVHGNNNVYGSTIYPHNIGLGCTRSGSS